MQDGSEGFGHDRFLDGISTSRRSGNENIKSIYTTAKRRCLLVVMHIFIYPSLFPLHMCPPSLFSAHNFAKLTLRFWIPLSIASLTSSVCNIAAFHTAV